MSDKTGTTGETPRTDAAKWISQYGRVECFVVEADFARTLEREWIGMKSEVQVCHQKIERLELQLAAAYERCAKVCSALGDGAKQRIADCAKWNPHDPEYYASHQEGVMKAHYEDAAAIRALNEGGKP